MVEEEEEEEALRHVVGLPEASIHVKDFPIEKVGDDMARSVYWQNEEDTEEGRTKGKAWIKVSFPEDTKAKKVYPNFD